MVNEEALVLDKARYLIIERNYCVSRIKMIKESLRQLTEDLDKAETELAALKSKYGLTFEYDEYNDEYLADTLQLGNSKFTD